MRTQFSAIALRATLVAMLAGSIAITPLSLQSVAARPAHASPVYLTAFQNFHSTMIRNFNPFATATRLDFTQGGIYEPLMVVTTAGKGHTYPWLATKYTWESGDRALLVTLRKGVKWSDGKPFTSADVVFTFKYGKKYPVADETGLMGKGLVTSVRAQGKYAVVFKFKTVDTTIVPQLLSTNVMIIPKHIWKSVTDPTTFTNPNPVGTGPFARVVSFSTQEYILGKNPYYWQKLTYDGIKVPALTDNNAALAASISGEVDWTGDFVPDAQHAYVARDSKHYHYFYSASTQPLGLYFNDQQYPYSLVAFRKAVSYAINRKDITNKAENGYEPPSDAIGINKLYPAWVDKSLTSASKELTTYNPSKAKQVLQAAGFTYKNGALIDPKGNPVTMDLSCPAGWNDWVTSLQIIQSNLKAIGISATFETKDQTAWLDARTKRQLGGFFWEPGSGPTPYNYFYSYMSKDSYFPIGQDALATGLNNLSGWYSTTATSLLQQFRQTTNTKLQHQIVDKLQKIQLNNLPFVPTVHGALWYTYSTLHFTGFPDKGHYYALGPTYQYPDDVKVLTTIKPVK